MATVDDIIQQSQSLSIQDRAHNDIVYGGNVLVSWLARANTIVAPWWSPTRDKQLREFWKKSDHLAGAVYTMTSKMTAIPNRVIAKDTSIKAHVEQAAQITDILQSATEFSGGWVDLYQKFVEDLVTQDNGAFMEVIGQGDPNGPIVGRPVSLAHLDSWRCQRTGNAIYPVIYTDTNGKRYRLHYTRVMYASQMSSPIAEMYGVGFSAVSRAINVSQTLIDILMYKQEKLGSRPHREILITRGGLDPNDLRTAFTLADSEMDSQGLSRYSKVVIGGSSSMPESDVKVIELSSLPDGFNEESSITLGMATIALAFGVDARELFPAMTAGATRADALLQHLKQRGKGPGQILQVTENLVNYKFLPVHLRFEFDFQDDAQDRQVAEIRKIRAESRQLDTNTQAMPTRVLRENMFKDGDIDRSQFERMELEDGRLPDGSSVLSLFYKKNSEYSQLLSLGVSDPLDTEKNDQMKMMSAIQKKKKEAMTQLVNSASQASRWNALYAIAALDELKELYDPMNAMAVQGVPPKQPGAPPSPDTRTRTSDLTGPGKNDRGNIPSDTLKPHPTDDKVQ